MEKIITLQHLISQSPLYGAYSDYLPESPDDEIILSLSKFLTTCGQVMSIDGMDLICREIIPKTVGFCGLVSSNFVTLKNLVPLMKLVSIVYLFDQTIDRAENPEIFLPFIEEIVNHEKTPLSSNIWGILKGFPPHHQDMLIDLGFRDVSLRQYSLRIKSKEHFDNPKKAYQEKEIEEIANAMIKDVGLQLVAIGVYICLLKEGIATENVNNLLRPLAPLITTLEGFLRICDDLGDVKLDKGVCINLFNNDIPELKKVFLINCDIKDLPLGLPLFKEFYNTSEGYIDQLKTKSPDNNLLILLLLRVMEGGFVNLVGDSYLTEGIEGIETDPLEILRDFNYKI